MLEGASDLSPEARRAIRNEEVQAKEAELFQADRWLPDANWSGLKKSLSWL